MRGSAFAAVVGAMVISAAPAAHAASAPAAAGHAPGDPWERINRVAFAFQGGLDRVIIRPAAHLFHALSPGPVGKGVHNVVVNLSEPVAFFNDVLQLRFKRAGVPAVRFITNSTIGILGLFDVAGHSGLPHHDNEFGVTLGRYGAGPGPYMFVPLVGPTTVRDLIGSGVDLVIDPFHWVGYANRPEISTIRGLVGGLDTRVMTEAQLNAVLSDATDPYATLRSVYLQNKQGEIEGGGVPVESLPSFDDPATPPPAPATAGATPIDGDAVPPAPVPDAPPAS
ncbi:MAG: VacJ family lipoprotein, partial [Caulobacteraceae bacterium]|nr:VacJ family lipoprotein [Caulobacteraceae bacterium]